MTTVYTIGYEKASIEDLVATLQLAGVRRLLDVREIAQSRRKGFSKTALAEALEAGGIEYSHVRQLGDPKPGREAARSGRMEEFRAIFESHLAKKETQDALSEAAYVVQEQPTALLCFERDPQDCHRTIVAERLSELCSLSVRHLGVVQDAEKRVRVSQAA